MPHIQTTELTRELLAISAILPGAVGINPERFESIAISGEDLAELMRRHGRTIRDVATKNGITLKRVRQWRQHGLSGFSAVDAVHAIAGFWIA